MKDQLDGDRRKEYRHKVCIDAKIITSNASFKALVSNISGGGLEIEGPSNVNPDSSLLISIMLTEEFVFRGTVIWTLCDYVNHKWIYRIGVQTDSISFRNVCATATEEKAELIQKILPQIEAKGAIFSEDKKMCA